MAPVEAGPVGRLAGQELQYIQLGDVLVLGLSAGSRVVIETVGRLNGRAEVVPGETPPVALELLLGETVRTARAGESGELAITFGDGSELLVGPDAETESWAVAGPAGELVVCLAGGEIAAWTEVPAKVVIH